MYPPNKYDFEPEPMTKGCLLKLGIAALLSPFIGWLLIWLMNRFL